MPIGGLHDQPTWTISHGLIDLHDRQLTSPQNYNSYLYLALMVLPLWALYRLEMSHFVAKMGLLFVDS